ncbi:MAG: methyltransferase domain-containing protein [Patescibacteria group bacterium]
MLEKIFSTAFAKMWQREAPEVDKKFRYIKKGLFGSARGTVLEIGPGTGVNFEYFPPNIHQWFGIEPNPLLQKVLRTHPKKPLSSKFVADIEELPNESVDTVVSSLVLCSVPNLEKTLREIRRVLKPCGRLLCIEHVAAPRGTLLRFLQRLIRPFSRRVGGGCEPDREIAAAIKVAGFSEVKMSENRIQISRIPILAPVIACEARK